MTRAVNTNFHVNLHRKVKAVSCALIALLLSACAKTSTTQIDYIETIDFTLFDSFQFTEQAKNSANPVLGNRIREVIKISLIEQNYTFQIKNADLQIKFHFTQQEKPNNSSFSIGIGGAKIGGSGGASVGVSTNIPIESNATIITKIFIDISHNNEAIWYGTDSYESENNMSAADKERVIAETVNRLLLNFPPSTPVNTK